MKTLKIISFGIKNNRVLAGFMLLICGFICPAIALMADRGSYHSSFTGYILVFGVAAAYFAGFFFPLVFFSYTRSRRLYDFYAAMPVKKRQYFWGYFFSGIIMFIVPVSVMDVILAVFGVGRGNLELSYFVGPLAVFFSIYCSMTLAVMFSGSTVSAVITFFLRNIFVICLVMPILFMAGVNIESYCALLYDKAIVTSPLLSAFPLLDKSLYWIWIWQFGIGILEVVAAFFLHKYRKSETTMALAFPKSRLPYQYTVLLLFVMTVNTVVMIVMGLYNGAFNSSKTYADRFVWGSGEMKVIVFVDVIAAFLMFVLLNIVLERSSRAAFKGIRHLLFFFVGFFVLAGLSVKLLNYIPRIYTPIDPDYAVVSVYRPVETDSVDPESEEFEKALSRGEYQCGYYYEASENSDDYIRRINWLAKREDFFVTTSKKSLDELVSICEGGRSYYSIVEARNYSFIGGYTNWRYSVPDESEALYFEILLAKGHCDRSTNPLGETVCTGYYTKKGLFRAGYVIGTASGLDIYKEYDIELPESDYDENYELMPGAVVRS